MAKALPLSVDLLSAETPASFAARLGRKNGIEYGTDFCLDMGFRLQDVADGRENALSSLAQLGGVDLNALSCFAVERIGETQYAVAGQELEKRWIQRSRLRFCPYCVADDLSDQTRQGAALQAYWHVPFIRTCCRHQIPIMEIAEICHTRGTHDFSGRLRDLEFSQDWFSKERTQRSPTKLECYLTKRIEGVPQNPWLDKLPFNAVAMASEALGLMLAFGPDKQIGGLSPSERCKAGEAGFEVVSNGEAAIRACLNDLHVQGGGPTWFQRRFYGYFFLWLEASKSKLYQPIKEIMREHIIATYPIGTGEDVLGKPCKRRLVHSIASAKAATGIEPKKIKHILHTNGFLDKDPKTGQFEKNVLFRADDIDPILRKFNGSICQVATRRRVNAPRAQFDVLLAHNIIKSIGGAGDARPSYDVAEIDNFLKRLSDGAVIVEPLTDQYVDIQTACRKTVSSAAEVVSLILNGRLKFVGRDPAQHGYRSVLVDPIEVAEQMQLTAPKGYMKHELGGLLGVNDPAVKYLTTSGLLPITKSRHPISRKAISIVSYADMGQFLETYAPAKTLAEALLANTRTIANRLEKLGITPIDMPDGCRGRIFEKIDLGTSEVGAAMLNAAQMATREHSKKIGGNVDEYV